eukprot:10816945-Alexandrium_andersonii.AAC.1
MAWISELRGLAPGRDASTPVAHLPTVIVRKNAQGVAKVTGGPGLKQTQSYPPGFGRAVMQLYKKHAHALAVDANSMMRDASRVELNMEDFGYGNFTLSEKELWRDAKLDD